MKETELGNFVRWGASVSVDMAKKLLTILPLSQPENLVEIPNEDVPAEESLDLRCSSY